MAFWVYALPVGEALGHTAAAVRLAISVAIGVQIAAGLAAIRYSILPAAGVVIGCLVAGLAALALIAVAPSALLFAAGLCLFSFAWVFVLGYHVPLVTDFDPTRRSVMMLTGVQLVGVALGPLLSASLIGGTVGLTPALVAAAAFALALAIVLAGRRSTR